MKTWISYLLFRGIKLLCFPIFQTDHEDEDVNGEEFDHEDYDNDTANENSNNSNNENQSNNRLMRCKNGYTILLRKLPTAGNFC